METVTLHIDGSTLEVEKGKTVLEASLEAGIYIPHLCHHPDLPNIGACRLCVIEIEGRNDIHTSCTTPVVDGMIVETKTPKLEEMRRLALELMLASHVDDCTECPKYLKCELQSLIQYLGVSSSRLRRTLNSVPVNTANPLFVRDLNRCVVCGRCVRVCEEVRGVKVLNYNKNSEGETYIGTEGDISMADANCRFCGACVEVCPTGALRDKEDILREGVPRSAALVPCRQECPAGIDIPRYIRYIRENKYSEAVAVIREKAPFPASLGHVCMHFCETACRRKEVNSAVSIKELKRFAAQNDKQLWKKNSFKKEVTGKRVAIVGAGPAGLTAAFYLAKLGHDVTAFEALPHAGGMMRVGIPEYRLPCEVVETEIKEIEYVGVKIKTSTKVESLDNFFHEGYDTVLVAIGTHKGQKIPIPGADAEGVLTNVDFLRAVSLGNEVDIGKSVLVLGGGNVAFDCARTARRLGAVQVHLACLEDRERMTASAEEIEEGEEEGIRIHNSKTFNKVLSENGKLIGVECSEVESFYFDENKKLHLKIAEGSEHVLPAETVIFATGQRPDIPEQFNLLTGRGGTIKVNAETLATSTDGVFAAGDTVTGTASVIQAIAAGRKSAISIDKYLGGQGIIDEVLVPVEETKGFIGREEKFAYQQRSKVGLEDVGQRTCNFGVVNHTLTETIAIEESNRCLQCDLRPKITKVKFWTEYPKK